MIVLVGASALIINPFTTFLFVSSTEALLCDGLQWFDWYFVKDELADSGYDRALL